MNAAGPYDDSEESNDPPLDKHSGAITRNLGRCDKRNRARERQQVETRERQPGRDGEHSRGGYPYVYFPSFFCNFHITRGKGGRSTSRNGANISAGEADPGERGEAAGRALVGTGEVSRATTTTGDREIGSYHQRGGTTTGEEDINDDGEPPPERGPLSARTGHHHLRETATGEDGPPMRRDHQWRGASMTAVEQQ